jgi:hypothetical protein
MAAWNPASTDVFSSKQYLTVLQASLTCHGRAMWSPRLMVGGLQHLHLQLTNIVHVRLSLVCKVLDFALRAWHIPAATTVDRAALLKLKLLGCCC